MRDHLINPNTVSVKIVAVPINNEFIAMAAAICPGDFFGKKTINLYNLKGLLFNADPKDNSHYDTFMDIGTDLILKAVCKAIDDFSPSRNIRWQHPQYAHSCTSSKGRLMSLGRGHVAVYSSHSEKIHYVNWIENTPMDQTFMKTLWSPAISRRIANYGDMFIAAFVNRLKEEIDNLPQSSAGEIPHPEKVVD